jgi:DNA-binding XRE family transcriptional regulator
LKDTLRNVSDWTLNSLKASSLAIPNFKVGVLLRQAREKAGMTQDDVARRLKTKRAAISRTENHAEDISLSTVQKHAKALGKNLRVEIMG